MNLPGRESYGGVTAGGGGETGCLGGYRQEYKYNNGTKRTSSSFLIQQHLGRERSIFFTENVAIQASFKVPASTAPLAEHGAACCHGRCSCGTRRPVETPAGAT